LSTILFTDTETGGLDPRYHSLLSVGVALWIDGRIVDTEQYFIKRDIYKVTMEALEVNKLNVIEVCKKGISEGNLFNSISTFLGRNEIDPLRRGVPRLTLGGHNINFDVGFLKEADAYLFNQMFSYRTVDTSAIARFLVDLGKLPEDLRGGSSQKLLDYFKIGDPDKRHDSLADAIDAANLYNALLGVVK
jgi:DNA polymerase-3 subunit epsilon